MQQQRTIGKSVSYTGIGLHLGKEVKVVLEPAPANQGVVFVREDLPNCPSLKAMASKVVNNERETTIGDGIVKITTVEHILAALSGMGIDNIVIKMNEQEFPAGDGSALPWIKLIQTAGIVTQDAPKRIFKVKSPFWIQD
ncbi:MAG TPA: UDP-3-O-[3-hydroxymyristoyl] N-acetylglucosamine deacetylase, partial [Candidatus Aerophobetes bacterium]|nr:UDP-3-O-[3-hydroxymyristoyl] N-acetylglucosamine deacetylase [Candidatus Aerophobetes bacterium]